MQQTFQCHRCGCVNYVGAGRCAGCGQVFSYNCPYCNAQVNNTFSTCPVCRNFLTWPGVQPQPPPPQPQGYPPAQGYQQQYGPYQPAQPQAGGTGQRRGGPWLIVALCVLLVGLAAGAIYYFTKGNLPGMPPPAPQSQQQLPAVDNEF